MGDINVQQKNPDNQIDQRLVGIRGWLIIPAILFAIAPIGIFYVLYNDLWSFNRMMGLDAGIFTILEIAFCIAILFYIFAVALRFLKKEQNSPQSCIHIVAFQLIAPILLLFLFTLSLLIRLTYRGKIEIYDHMIYILQEIVLQIAVLFYVFVASLRFFKKSQNAPQTIIRYIVFVFFARLLILILRHVFIGSINLYVLLHLFVT